MGNMENKILRRLSRVIRNPRKLIAFAASHGLFKWLPDKPYLLLLYYALMGEKLNLKEPKTFGEKLQWLKLYDRRPEYTIYVDKYAVRNYIKETIGEKYLIPLIGVYNDVNELDFDKLPDQFVLKCTHDSGSIIICKDKYSLNIEDIKQKLNKCLKRNYYYTSREWPYKNVKPRIVCEKFMVDESGFELKDYKIFCFSGEPKLIIVDFGRFGQHKRNLFDTKWNYINASIQFPTDPTTEIEKPEKLEEMLRIASILSKDYPHIRVDFYYIYGDIYFGELTLYNGSGYSEFEPQSLALEMGNWIKLPTLRN